MWNHKLPVLRAPCLEARLVDEEHDSPWFLHRSPVHHSPAGGGDNASDSLDSDRLLGPAFGFNVDEVPALVHDDVLPTVVTLFVPWTWSKPSSSNARTKLSVKPSPLSSSASS